METKRNAPRLTGLVAMAVITAHVVSAAIDQAAGSGKPTVPADGKAAAGYRLFDHNCAHCHGDDARGDEGPSLYDLRKSDERLQKIIKNGIKGEMPSFSKKFTDDDVQALIAYLRTLKEKGDPLDAKREAL